MGDHHDDHIEGAAPLDTFGVAERCTDGVAVLHVRGEIDVRTAPPLTDAVEAALAKSPVGARMSGIDKPTPMTSWSGH